MRTALGVRAVMQKEHTLEELGALVHEVLLANPARPAGVLRTFAERHLGSSLGLMTSLGRPSPGAAGCANAPNGRDLIATMGGCSDRDPVPSRPAPAAAATMPMACCEPRPHPPRPGRPSARSPSTRADEKETFRRHLPATKYQFVELVERGRPDWLASACRAGVRCDVLVISGHYDGGNEFFSDQLEAREFLPVAELERVSCSDSCPGLFSQLKEVYLFGCNTLNPRAAEQRVGRDRAQPGARRTLARGGRARAAVAERARTARAAATACARSSRTCR